MRLRFRSRCGGSGCLSVVQVDIIGPRRQRLSIDAARHSTACLGPGFNPIFEDVASLALDLKPLGLPRVQLIAQPLAPVNGQWPGQQLVDPGFQRVDRRLNCLGHQPKQLSKREPKNPFVGIGEVHASAPNAKAKPPPSRGQRPRIAHRHLPLVLSFVELGLGHLVGHAVDLLGHRGRDSFEQRFDVREDDRKRQRQSGARRLVRLRGAQCVGHWEARQQRSRANRLGVIGTCTGRVRAGSGIARRCGTTLVRRKEKAVDRRIQWDPGLMRAGSRFFRRRVAFRRAAIRSSGMGDVAA